MYLSDVPAGLMFQLFFMLDVDDTWERLAAQLGYTMQEIAMFGQVGHRRLGGGGPTRCLIMDWLTLRPTVDQLYNALYNAKLLHACQFIEQQGLLSDSPRGQMPQYVMNEGQTHRGQMGQGQPYTQGQMFQGQPYTRGQMSQGQLDSQGQMPQGQPYNQEQIRYQVQMSQRAMYDMGQMSQGQINTKGHMYPQDQPNREQISQQRPSTQGPEFQGPQDIPLPRPPVERDGVPSVPVQKNVWSDVNLNKAQSNTPKSCGSDKTKSVATLASYGKTPTAYPCIGPEDRLSRTRVPFDAIGFPWGDIQDGTNGFSSNNRIGEGGFGVVYRVNLRKTTCAVKVLKEFDQPDEEKETIESNLTEIAALFKYRHQNIIGLIGYSVYSPHTCIVYEYMVNGSLQDRLQCKGETMPLAWVTRHRIMMGAARGLQYLHTVQEKPLIHGDVKSANILLDQNFEAKLSDFGQARQAQGSGTMTETTQKDMKETPIYATRAYLPGDFFNSMKLTIATDTFGYGVVVFEVCTGQRADDPKRGKKEDRFLRDYIRKVYENASGMDLLMKERDPLASDWPDDLYTEIMQLGIHCTERRRKARPEMTTVLTTLERLESESQIITSQSITGQRLPSSSHKIEFESNQHSITKLQKSPSLQPPSSIGSSKSFGELDSHPTEKTCDPVSDDPQFSVCNLNKLTYSERLRESQLGQHDIEQGMRNISLVPPSSISSTVQPMSVPLAIQVVYDSGAKIPSVGSNKDLTSTEPNTTHSQLHTNDSPQKDQPIGLPDQISQPTPVANPAVASTKYARSSMASLLGTKHLEHVLIIQKKSFPFEKNSDCGNSPSLHTPCVVAENRCGTEGMDPAESDKTDGNSQYCPLRSQPSPSGSQFKSGPMDTVRPPQPSPSGNQFKSGPMETVRPPQPSPSGNQFKSGPLDTVRPPSVYTTDLWTPDISHVAMKNSASNPGESFTPTPSVNSRIARASNIFCPSFEAPDSSQLDDISSIEMYGGEETSSDFSASGVGPESSSTTSGYTETSRESEDQSRFDISLRLQERHRRLKEPQEG